jgi:hypothetical protein
MPNSLQKIDLMKLLGHSIMEVLYATADVCFVDCSFVHQVM